MLLRFRDDFREVIELDALAHKNRRKSIDFLLRSVINLWHILESHWWSNWRHELLSIVKLSFREFFELIVFHCIVQVEETIELVIKIHLLSAVEVSIWWNQYPKSRLISFFLNNFIDEFTWLSFFHKLRSGVNRTLHFSRSNLSTSTSVRWRTFKELII